MDRQRDIETMLANAPKPQVRSGAHRGRLREELLTLTSAEARQGALQHSAKVTSAEGRACALEDLPAVMIAGTLEGDPGDHPTPKSLTTSAIRMTRSWP